MTFKTQQVALLVKGVPMKMTSAAAAAAAAGGRGKAKLKWGRGRGLCEQWLIV